MNVSAFLPCWIDLLSVGIYLISAMMWVSLFYDASDGKFHKVSSTIFTCLYMSFPYLAEIFIFMPADFLSAFNMFFASLGAWNAWMLFKKKDIKKLILAIIFIAMGFGFYESVLVYFLCGVMIALFLEEVFSSSCKIRELIYKMLVLLGIIAGGVLLSKVILKLFLKHYNILENNYTGGYFKYNIKDNIVYQIWKVIKELMYLIFTRQDLVDFTLIISIIIIIIISVIVSFKKKNAISILLALGIIVSNFAIILGTGNLSIAQNTERILVTYGLFTSFSISMGYSIIMQIEIENEPLIKVKKILQIIVISGVLILNLRQSREMMGIFWADHLRATLDERKAGYINYEVEKTNWESKPVIFVGVSQDYLGVKDSDPLGSYFHFFYDRTDAERNNYLHYYMNALGYVYPIGLEDGMLEVAIENSIQQPKYPLDGYVTEYDKYIVVKLGSLDDE